MITDRAPERSTGERPGARSAISRGGGVRLGFDGPHVAVLSLDARPAGVLSAYAQASLRGALDRVEADRDVRAVVLTGSTGHFSAGAELGEDRAGTGFLETLLATVDRVEQLRVPTVAAVAGGAVGGGLELALACDIRIAAEDAFFVAAGVNVGLVMSTWRLPRLIGPGPAKAMLLTGEPCDAATSLRTGLVREVVPADALLPAALATAHRIAGRSPLAVEATKVVAGRALGQDRRTARADLLARCAELVRSRDHREAVRAFLERRTARFHRM